MNDDELRQLAEKIVYEHLDKSWKIRFSKKMTSCAGLCSYVRKEIVLSLPLTKYRTVEETKDTILYETAHALVGSEHGHNKIWKAKAIEIGCSGRRCYGRQPEELRRESKHRYWYRCPECKRTFMTKRKLKKEAMCAECYDLGIDPCDCILELYGEEHYN